jgi:hypothetical protein
MMVDSNRTSAARSPLGITFFLLLVAHVILKLHAGWWVASLAPTGDENAYIDAAKALSNLCRDVLHLARPDFGELRRNVVVNGWFMPGMPVVLTPLYALAPDASTTTFRVYLGCVSFALWLWAVLCVHCHLGRIYACALMVFPSLVPLWLAFSFTAWGDLYAGLLIVILFCHSFTAIRKIHDHGVFTPRDGIRLGALAVAALYLRSSVLPLALLLFGFLGFVSLTSTCRHRRIHMFVGIAAAIGTFIVVLLPWSLSASLALHAPVTTTTTVPLSMAVTFGDHSKLCFGPCGRGNIWFRTAGYSKAVARDAGVSELTIQKEMSRYAMQGVTPAGYASDVLGNFGRYAFDPGSFALFFSKTSLPASEPHDSRTSWLRASTTIPYFAFMALLVVAWFTVVKRTRDDQIASLLIKLFSVALLVQPFVHVSGGRYWTTFGPMFALAAGLLWSLLRHQRIAGCTNAPPSAWLTSLQWAFAAGIVVASGTLLTLGAQGGYFRP